MAKISAIIPTMKGREAMLEKLKSTLPKDCEVIVVDDEDLLLAAKRNKGARKATGEYLFFVDDDNYLADFALIEMLKSWEPSIGVMGMTACYDDKPMRIADGGSMRNCLTGFTKGMHTNNPLWLGGRLDLYPVDEVANAFMIPKIVFQIMGGFDEVNFPIDLDEADFCKRAKDAGFIVCMNSKAICYHKSNTYSPIPNFRRELSAYFLSRNIILYQRKHLNALSFIVFCLVFLPVRVCFYFFSLVWYKNPQMILPMMKGYFDGLRNKKDNPYQSKPKKESWNG